MSLLRPCDAQIIYRPQSIYKIATFLNLLTAMSPSGNTTLGALAQDARAPSERVTGGVGKMGVRRPKSSSPKGQGKGDSVA
jgi:hypothetical protein